MSWEPYDWVWQSSTLKGNQRLVMLALAKHADDDGVCWPSVRTLAEMCQVNPKTVLRAIEAAEERGELTVTRPRKNGRGKVNKYRILLGDNLQTSRSEKIPPRDRSEVNGPISVVNGPISDPKWSHLSGTELPELPDRTMRPILTCDDGHLWDDDGTSYGECPTCRGQGCDTWPQLEAVQG